MEKGLFVTFEGPEGSGKSTQIRGLKDYLSETGYSVTNTREPGGTPLGEKIRGLLQHDMSDEAPCPEAEVYLFAASRAQHVNRLILPALKKGDVVLCDRFAHSSFAYQGFGRGFGYQAIFDANYLATRNCMPDLVFLLDLTPEESQKRMMARFNQSGQALDRIEREPQEFHKKLREGFLEMAANDSYRFRVINAKGDIPTIQKQIQNELRNSPQWQEYTKRHSEIL